MQGGPVFDPKTANLISRLTAKGETPTTPRQTAMNTAIVALRAAGLFETMFDVLVVTRGYGEYTTKENWIQDAHHALGVNNPTYTAGIGYNNNGSSSCIDSQYTPSTNGILYTLNDASYGFKMSGVSGANTLNGGINCSVGSYGAALFNCSSLFGLWTAAISAGYNTLIRINSSNASLMVNSSKLDYSTNSTSLPSVSMNILAYNAGSWRQSFSASTQILEMYWMGKSMTQAQFLTFQGIMNTYFASI